MPFNELKIDRFLVRDIGVREDAATIVETIIILGHKLGIVVCAEGVENKESLDFLVKAGCDKVQGFYVGRPSSARLLEKKVREFKEQGFAGSDDAAAANATPTTQVLPDQSVPIH